MTFTSQHLQEGQIYTRENLRELFQITDKTLYTGIFRPAGHNSIWLFITEQKSADRTQYIDRLDGDTLSWQGQTQGLKDKLIIDHKARGLELLVFYRTSKTEYPGAGFRYEGRFAYLSHTGAQPTSFLLGRIDRSLEVTRQDREAPLAEEEGYLENKRTRGTVSLLSQHYRDFLDLIYPQWQFRLLKSQSTTTIESLQKLADCNLLTLGDLSTVTPLMLLSLGAKVAGPPAEGAPFWEHLLHQERNAIKPLLQAILIEQINTSLSKPQKPAPHQPTEVKISSTEGETGYSSLLIQPGEVIDQWTYPDSITIVNWPHGVKRRVAFPSGAICATPLLAAPVRDALRAAGCDLRSVPLSALPLSTRTANVFIRARFVELEGLTCLTPDQLMMLRSFGSRALEETLYILREYLLPRLEAVPPDTLVPPEPLHPFDIEVELQPQASNDVGIIAPQKVNTTPPQNNGYSSLFVQIDKVLREVYHPSAPILTLYTPAGKVQWIRFDKGEVRATPLLASYLRDALRKIGCDLSAIPLTRLPLSAQDSFSLAQAHIETLEQLVQVTPEELLLRHGLSTGRYEEVVGLVLECLNPWLACLPLAILVPEHKGHSELQPDHLFPRRGKNALFFPVDAVLQALSSYSSQADASGISLSEEDVSQNALLSGQLIAALAERGCVLVSNSIQELFPQRSSESTPMSVRTYHALIRAGIRTLGQLASRTPKDLLRIRNFGAGCYREVNQALYFYLQPWFDTLGIDPASEESLLAYHDPLPLAFDQPAEPEETISLSDVFAELVSPDLFNWLDYYQVPWRQLPLAEACPVLTNDAKIIFQGGLTLGDLTASGQMTSPEPLIAPEVAEQAITEIQQSLVAMLAMYLIEAATSGQEQQNNQPALTLVSVESLLAEVLNQYILTNRKSSGRTADDLPREIHVLLARSGVIDGQPQSLGELGTTFSLTRERVRQLELRAEERLFQGAVRLSVEGLAALVKWAIQAEGGLTTVSGAAERVATWLPFGKLDPSATIRLLVKWGTNTPVKGDARLLSSSVAPELLDEIDGFLEQFLDTESGSLPFEQLLDKVMLAGGDTFYKFGRTFVATAIQLSDVIEIQDGFCSLKGNGRGRKSYKAQLVNVLKHIGRPAHFNEIAKRFNALYPEEKPRADHAIHSVLLRFPEVFARTGSGTYALAERGYEGTQTVADALERILQESGRPMHTSDIVAHGKETFQWKESALRAGLQTHSKIVALGHGFYGLSIHNFPGFDAAKAYEERFGGEPIIQERLVVATYTNQQHHPVVQIKLTTNTVKGYIPLTSKELRALLPHEGTYLAEAYFPGSAAVQLTLKRGTHDFSGVRPWFQDINAQPGDFLFLEKLAATQDAEASAYRLAFGPAGQIEEAMQTVGLSPTRHEAGGILDARVLWRVREPEKLSGLLAYTLEHPWPTLTFTNAALGFAPGRPEGPEYVELGLLGGLLALGKIEGVAASDVIRATPFGRAWITQRHDADTLAVSLALSLPAYRAHLRSDFQGEASDDDIDAEQMTTALLDPKLLEAWDARFGLAASERRVRALRESNAVVTTARLPGPVLTLLLLLLAAQSNGLGISLLAAETSGLPHVKKAAFSLRQLGIAVQWNANGQVALAEQVHLAVTSSASVGDRLRMHNGLLGAALAESWQILQQNTWPLHHVNAADLYTELTGTHGALFTSLLVPTPEEIDQAARYVDGRCVPCPFVPLLADWGRDPAEPAPMPFAFLSHAIQMINMQAVGPIAICLNRELLTQEWDVKCSLAANAHLALLTLIACDTGGLSEYCTLGEQGYLLGGRPLILALDDLLRGLGYVVWDEGYQQDAALQATLGRELVALGEQLGLFTNSSNSFESLSPLGTEVYYSAYDVVLRLQAISLRLATGK